MAFRPFRRQSFKNESIAAFAVFALAWVGLSAQFCAAIAAGEGGPLAALEARYRKASTLEANFLERYSENGKQVRVEAGKAYFLRPGKMRWEYEKPEKSLFLVDGKFVWFYAPDDHTATRMPAKKSEDWRTPIAFLTTGMKLSRICSEVGAAQEAKPAKAGNEVYGCVLRGTEDGKGDAAQTVLFEITPQRELARIAIPQEGGMQIEF